MATDQEIAEAREMGWVPKEEFRGDINKWVDADTYVQHGKAVMPILRKNNETLRADITGLRGQLSQLQAALEQSQQTIKDLQDFHAENVKQRVEKARSDLLAEISRARKEEDVEAETAAIGELSRLDAAAEADKKAGHTETTSSSGNGEKKEVKLDPAFVNWAQGTGWYGLDPVKTGLADGISRKLRAEDPNFTLKGVDFLRKVEAEVEKVMGGGARGSSQHVEGGGNGADAGTGGGGHSFSDLPADAKAKCNAQASKFVGPGKLCKDLQAWQSYFASQWAW